MTQRTRAVASGSSVPAARINQPRGRWKSNSNRALRLLRQCVQAVCGSKRAHETGGRPTAGARESPTQVASRIAAEVRHGHTRDETKLAKRSSLLHAFHATGSPTGFSGVVTALKEQGVRVDSVWGLEAGAPNIRPTGVLDLSLDRALPQHPPDVDRDDTIQMSVWGPGSARSEERSLAGDETPPAGGVLWFNVDPPQSDGAGVPTHDAFEARVLDVASKLARWCPGLNGQMVRDLLQQDVQPKVDTYGDENDGVRGISVLAVIAREAPGTRNASDAVSEELVFQIVEMIVGEGWIVTCWHPSRVFIGTDEPQSSHSVLREPFLSHVRHRWQSGMSENSPSEPKTSSDLAVYLARTLVATYEASHRMIERWVASWEVTFYRSLSSEKKAEHLKDAAREISNLLSMVGEFRRRLTAFEHARWVTTDKTWFPTVSDGYRASAEDGDKSEQGLLASTIESTEKTFALLSDTIRADINLLMLQSAATQQETTEKLQTLLGKVTGLVLVPTLVAAVFGANTRLPAEGTWLGFAIMLILMVLTATAAYIAIRRLGR